MTSAADDMLVRVQSELRRRNGELREIAEAANMHYDTVRRIRSGTNDPGYSKVRRLAEFLGVIPAVGSPQETPPASRDGQEARHAA